MLPVSLTARMSAALAAVAISFVIAPPASAQTPAAAQAPFVFPPAPGQLLDIGGRRLHIRCVGPQKGRVVIFEAGLSGFTAFSTYTKAQEAVGGGARVCTYDRAGLGWSDPAPPGRTLADLTTDLHRLTRAARLKAPYVLVGHSFGGPLVRNYARTYPREVAGLVLADATPISFTPESVAARASPIAQIDKALATAKPRTPVIPLPANTPPEVVISTLPEILATERDEFGLYERSRAAMETLGSLGDLPFVVLRRGKVLASAFETNWRLGQEAQAALSTNSQLVVATKAGHVIPYDDPDLTAAAIRAVLAAARTGTKLTAVAP